MDVASCGEGLRRAAAEYSSWQRGGTDGTFAAFVCSSWMLDPHYAMELAAGSNIVRFQRECYCFPTGAEGDGLSGYERLFPTDERRGTPPQPGDSSLQTAFLRHASAGGRWVGGGCFLLRGDVGGYGEQVYYSGEYHTQRRRDTTPAVVEAMEDKVAAAAVVARERRAVALGSSLSLFRVFAVCFPGVFAQSCSYFGQPRRWRRRLWRQSRTGERWTSSMSI